MSYTLETTYASIPATTRGKPFVLNGDPKGNNFLYVCGNSVVIRNIADPKISETYDEHQHAPTVAKYSPSGFYICSGDSVGNVRIWDTTQKEHILKAEYRVLGGAIYDLDWSDDSKRIVVCGDGREKYAHAFLMDSGSSVGELSGHIKPVSSITFKQTRPYRVASCGEDFQVNWYEGPPFKFKNKKTGHSRFVNCTRFSPDGNHLASGGSDKLLILYDGKTGEQTKVINAHDGGIYSLSWSPDSTRILTASADRTCKIWDVASGNCVTTFKFENTIDNQQLGCLWQGNFLLSVNLAGHITYLNEQDPDHPIRVIKGHNKFVTALDIDRANNKILSGSYDATITRWDIDSGSNENILGKGHGNQVTQFSIDGDNLVSGGMDDTVRITPTNAKEYTATSVKVDAPVVGVSSSKGTIVAATMKSIYVIQGGAIKSNFSPSWDPLSIAINAAGTEVAVGASDNNIYLYTLSGTSLNAKSTLEGHRGGVTSLKYNANGDLASGGKDRNVMVWKNGSLSIGNWLFHAAPVMDVAWSPDGTRVASAAQDQHLIVWNTNEVNKHIQIKGAHRGGANRVAWLNNNTVISAGQDCNVKSWKLNF